MVIKMSPDRLTVFTPFVSTVSDRTVIGRIGKMDSLEIRR
jgi:hypothetical protein